MSRPLENRGVVVTRPRSQAAGLVALLEENGARVVEFPTIRIEPVESFDKIDAAVQDMAAYDWVIFTSVNGVAGFARRLGELGKDADVLRTVRVAAIGPATAAALGELGVDVEAVPERYQAEGLIAALGRESLDGARILIPRAEHARDVLPEELRRLGARVEVLVVYRTVRPDVDPAILRRALRGGQVDVLTFTSSSTVTNFVATFATGEAVRLVREAGAVVACIGPITAGTARQAGFDVAVQPESFTVPALAAALVEHFAGEPV